LLVAAAPVRADIAFEEVRGGSAQSSATVATGSTLPAVEGHLYVAAVTSKPHASVSTVTGLGLEWSQVVAQCSGRNNTGISIWIAQGSPSGGGPVQASLASSPRSAAIAVSRYSGVRASDPIGRVVAANSNPDGGCSGGTDGAAYSLPLPPPGAQSGPFFAAAALRNRRHAPGAGFVERAEIVSGSGGDAATVAVQDGATTGAVSGSFSGAVDWAAAAIELLPAGAVAGCTSDAACSDGRFCNGAESCDALLGCRAGPAPSCADEIACTADSCDAATDACVHVPSAAACDNGVFCDGAETCAAGVGCQPGAGCSGACDEAGRICVGPGVPSGPPALQAVTGGTATGSPTVASDPVAAVADELYLAVISPRPNRAVTGVSGLGLAWTPVASQCSGRSITAVSVWRAIGTPSAAGPVTATFAAPTTAAVISVLRYSGVDPDVPIGATTSKNTRGVGGACTGGTDQAAYSMSLTTGAEHSLALGLVAIRHRAHTPGAGYTERFEIRTGTGADAAAVAGEDRALAAAGPVVVDGTLKSSVDWASVALELRARAAGTGCASDASCDDGLFCNGAESCAAGSCVAGIAVDCDDGVACTADSCDPASDACMHAPDDALCDDGVACNGAERCEPGVGCRLAACGAPASAPFGVAELAPDLSLNGAGANIDSLAFWEAPDAAQTLLFVTAKNNQLVEVWRHPFVGNELAALEHESFAGSHVNGVLVEQSANRLYVSVGSPASALAVFSLPALEYLGDFVQGAVSLRSEPNLGLLALAGGQRRLYASADDIVYAFDAGTGASLGSFAPAVGLETLVGDAFHGALYVPDENDRTGVHVYDADGNPVLRNGANHFGAGVFESDAEGILVYRCPSDGSGDDGSGWIVVSDQKSDATEFEFFDRASWAHLGAVRLSGVSNTDGIASTQRALPGHPLGLFAAVDDDTRTVLVGWDRVLAATGLSCAVCAPAGCD
jgi:hypothetical protein